MSDRLFSFVLLLLGLIYGASARILTAPFSYDPLGPAPFPLFLAALLTILATLLVIHPQPIDLPRAATWKRFLWLAATLVFYQLTWLPLGFLLSTTISLYLLSRLFHCSWMQGLMTALILSVICYGVFNFLLNAPLPLGSIFSYGGN